MPKAPDLESLAKTYLDLWQDQFATMAADPATADAMALFIGAMQGTMTGGWGSKGDSASQPQAPDGGDDKGHPGENQRGENQRSDDADGAAPAGATPRDRGDGVPELLARIAGLERRIDALERAARRAGGSAKENTSKD